MATSGPPPWGPDDTGAIPVGPEPEPTGSGGGGEGSGGWGGKPKTEPFAIAALVWAIVSIVIPIVGTIVALVLAARAADSIRRSRGTRSGMQIVTAARITAGAVIVLWAIGAIAFVALGGSDDNSGNKVAVPTQPPVTSTTLLPSTTTTHPPTTTLAPITTTTTVPQPTVITVPPPPTAPPTAPPTQPPTAPPTQPPTTLAPTTTTTPQQGLTKKIQASLGPSNRGVPPDEQVEVQYTPGATLVVTWAINNGALPLPVGQPTCTSPPASTTTTTTTTSPGATTTSTTTTSTSTTSTTTTTLPADVGTRTVARREAHAILVDLKPDIHSGKLDVTGVQLVGTFPIEGPNSSDVDVVQVFYAKSIFDATLPAAAKVFVAPPATDVQCLNPAFD